MIIAASFSSCSIASSLLTSRYVLPSLLGVVLLMLMLSYLLRNATLVHEVGLDALQHLDATPPADAALGGAGGGDVLADADAAERAVEDAANASSQSRW